MQYKLNNKNINIPNEEIDRISKGLQVDQTEAIQIWLEDNEYLINEEQEELNQAKKGFKIQHNAHSFEPRKQKPRERKEDPEKEGVISALATFLQMKYENVKVVNVGKIIEFDIADNHYKIDLIRQRKKKG